MDFEIGENSGADEKPVQDREEQPHREAGVEFSSSFHVRAGLPKDDVEGDGAGALENLAKVRADEAGVEDAGGKFKGEIAS